MAQKGRTREKKNQAEKRDMQGAGAIVAETGTVPLLRFITGRDPGQVQWLVDGGDGRQ